ncbi:hypothetical protein GCM10023205_83690 [Yinghuangia aomiensis]|uniref:DNA primase/polymerase bifunctional N-terminal domain-containing protein n=2 Tax=Yinghuangia aomiensis TaxID=676205 RepID=A0ABP9II53_9ACTN
MWWLSSAADDPRACRDGWYHDPGMPQLVAAGRLFDVVLMPMSFGLEVLGRMVGDERFAVGSVVIGERRAKLGFLVGPGSQADWPGLVSTAGAADAKTWCLGKGGYLVAPGALVIHDLSIWWERGPTGEFDDLTSLSDLANAVGATWRDVQLTDAGAASLVGSAGGR